MSGANNTVHLPERDPGVAAFRGDQIDSHIDPER